MKKIISAKIHFEDILQNDNGLIGGRFFFFKFTAYQNVLGYLKSKEDLYCNNNPYFESEYFFLNNRYFFQLQIVTI